MKFRALTSSIAFVCSTLLLPHAWGLGGQPTQPAIAWMPPTPQAGTQQKLVWNMWWGSVGTYWQLYVNDVQEGSNIKTFDSVADAQNTQQGSTVLNLETAGSKKLVIALCNANGCTKSHPVTLNVQSVQRASTASTPTPAPVLTRTPAPGPTSLAVTPPSQPAPTTPVIAWMPPTPGQGTQLHVVWNMWWGVPGTYWQLWVNDVQDAGNITSFDSVADPVNTQQGSKMLSLQTPGVQKLVIALCNARACTRSNPVTLTVQPVTVSTHTPAPMRAALPTPPAAPELAAVKLPTAPVIAWMPVSYKTGNQQKLIWNMWWGTPGSYWQLWVNDVQDGNNISAFDAVTDPVNTQQGSQLLSLQTAGTKKLAVALCNASGCTKSTPLTITVEASAAAQSSAPAQAPAQATASAPAPAQKPTPVATPTPVPTPAPTSAQITNEPPRSETASKPNRRVFLGYYPSAADNASLAALPATYTHVSLAFADPNFSWDGGKSWNGTGLQFTDAPTKLKETINTLHTRGVRVLLAVGGAAYTNWAALAAEGKAGSMGPLSRALGQAMKFLNLDGLDMDFEVEGADEATVVLYKNAIKALRMAVDAAGTGRVLTLAGSPTGADCTEATNTQACNGKTSYWGGSAGRERLVFADPAMAPLIDMVNVMSYDAGFENYDAVMAYKLYRALLPASVVVNIGLEIAPQGWGDALLVLEDKDAQCAGSVVVQDQFGNSVKQAYSVDRLARAPLANNTNARDGVMLWDVLRAAPGNCGSAPLASPETLRAKISSMYRSK